VISQRCRRGFTSAEKTELWERWQRGESLKAIGRAFGKPSWVALVRLAAEETIEALEAVAGRPTVERTGGACFPHGRLVHLAESCRVVAVQSSLASFGF
jgi:hypothetical protein